MSGYSFRPMTTLRPPAAWRGIDLAVARWVLAHGGSSRLAEVAGWASHADGQGHPALALDEDRHASPGPAMSSAEQWAALASEPMVGDGRSPTPFVLEPGRFYLWRNFAEELGTARMLRERRAAATPERLDDADLDALFHSDRGPAVAAQRLAVASAPGRKLFVLSGGPGTGKTTTVLRMLLGLLHHAADARPTVRIAAPTGKAAQRLAQSLRAGKRALGDAAALPPAWRPLLEAIPGDEPFTLHRLLGVDGRSQRFRRHADDPLSADILVVDEASMIDLALMRGLLAALRPEASLVLVGDPDQLGPVGAGPVLADLVEALAATGGEDLVRLDHSFRADDALLPILRAVRDGDPGRFHQAWRAAGERARQHLAADPAALWAHLRDWAGRLHALWRQHDLTRPLDPADPGADAAHRLAIVRERQLLCALREGEFGAEACNARLEAHLRQAGGLPEHATWYPGRLLMITRNDYGAGLFNGDIGLTLADADGRLGVWFEAGGPAGHPAARRFAPGLLPAHEGGFAITVHKSQGSEYGEVGLVLPPDPEHPLLTRQLVYTALSRARESITVIGPHSALDAALARRLVRHGGLVGRIVGG